MSSNFVPGMSKEGSYGGSEQSTCINTEGSLRKKVPRLITTVTTGRTLGTPTAYVVKRSVIPNEMVINKRNEYRVASRNHVGRDCSQDTSRCIEKNETSTKNKSCMQQVSNLGVKTPSAKAVSRNIEPVQSVLNQTTAVENYKDKKSQSASQADLRPDVGVQDVGNTLLWSTDTLQRFLLVQPGSDDDIVMYVAPESLVAVKEGTGAAHNVQNVLDKATEVEEMPVSQNMKMNSGSDVGLSLDEDVICLGHEGRKEEEDIQVVYKATAQSACLQKRAVEEGKKQLNEASCSQKQITCGQYLALGHDMNDKLVGSVQDSCDKSIEAPQDFHQQTLAALHTARKELVAVLQDRCDKPNWLDKDDSTGEKSSAPQLVDDEVHVLCLKKGYNSDGKSVTSDHAIDGNQCDEPLCLKKNCNCKSCQKHQVDCPDTFQQDDEDVNQPLDLSVSAMSKLDNSDGSLNDQTDPLDLTISTLQKTGLMTETHLVGETWNTVSDGRLSTETHLVDETGNMVSDGHLSTETHLVDETGNTVSDGRLSSPSGVIEILNHQLDIDTEQRSNYDSVKENSTSDCDMSQNARQQVASMICVAEMEEMNDENNNLIEEFDSEVVDVGYSYILLSEDDQYIDEGAKDFKIVKPRSAVDYCGSRGEHSSIQGQVTVGSLSPFQASEGQIVDSVCNSQSEDIVSEKGEVTSANEYVAAEVNDEQLENVSREIDGQLMHESFEHFKDGEDLKRLAKPAPGEVPEKKLTKLKVNKTMNTDLIVRQKCFDKSSLKVENLPYVQLVGKKQRKQDTVSMDLNRHPLLLKRLLNAEDSHAVEVNSGDMLSWRNQQNTSSSLKKPTTSTRGTRDSMERPCKNTPLQKPVKRSRGRERVTTAVGKTLYKCKYCKKPLSRPYIYLHEKTCIKLPVATGGCCIFCKTYYKKPYLYTHQKIHLYKLATGSDEPALWTRGSSARKNRLKDSKRKRSRSQTPSQPTEKGTNRKRRKRCNVSTKQLHTPVTANGALWKASDTVDSGDTSKRAFQEPDDNKAVEKTVQAKVTDVKKAFTEMRKRRRNRCRKPRTVRNPKMALKRDPYIDVVKNAGLMDGVVDAVKQTASQKKYQCSKCNFASPHWQLYKIHDAVHKEQSDQYLCEPCGIMFKSVKSSSIWHCKNNIHHAGAYLSLKSRALKLKSVIPSKMAAEDECCAEGMKRDTLVKTEGNIDTEESIVEMKNCTPRTSADGSLSYLSYVQNMIDITVPARASETFGDLPYAGFDESDMFFAVESERPKCSNIADTSKSHINCNLFFTDEDEQKGLIKIEKNWGASYTAVLDPADDKESTVDVPAEVSHEMIEECQQYVSNTDIYLDGQQKTNTCSSVQTEGQDLKEESTIPEDTENSTERPSASKSRENPSLSEDYLSGSSEDEDRKQYRQKHKRCYSSIAEVCVYPVVDLLKAEAGEIVFVQLDDGVVEMYKGVNSQGKYRKFGTEVYKTGRCDSRSDNTAEPVGKMTGNGDAITDVELESKDTAKSVGKMTDNGGAVDPESASLHVSSNANGYVCNAAATRKPGEQISSEGQGYIEDAALDDVVKMEIDDVRTTDKLKFDEMEETSSEVLSNRYEKIKKSFEEIVVKNVNEGSTFAVYIDDIVESVQAKDVSECGEMMCKSVPEGNIVADTEVVMVDDGTELVEVVVGGDNDANKRSLRGEENMSHDTNLENVNLQTELKPCVIKKALEDENNNTAAGDLDVNRRNMEGCSEFILHTLGKDRSSSSGSIRGRNTSAGSSQGIQGDSNNEDVNNNSLGDCGRDGDDDGNDENNNRRMGDDGLGVENRDVEFLLCLVCQTSFSKKIDLMKHLTKVHLLTNLCQFCYFTEQKVNRFANPVSLRNHKLRVHAELMVRCVCGTLLIDEKMLAFHQNKFKCHLKPVSGDTSEKMVKCVCGKRFRSMDLLQGHKSRCRRRDLSEVCNDNYLVNEAQVKCVTPVICPASSVEGKVNKSTLTSTAVQQTVSQYDANLNKLALGSSAVEKRASLDEEENSDVPTCILKGNPDSGTDKGEIGKDSGRRGDISFDHEYRQRRRSMRKLMKRYVCSSHTECNTCRQLIRPARIFVHQKLGHQRKRALFSPAPLVQAKPGSEGLTVYRCRWCRFVAAHHKIAVKHHYSNHTEKEVKLVAMETLSGLLPTLKHSFIRQRKLCIHGKK